MLATNMWPPPKSDGRVRSRRKEQNDLGVEKSGEIVIERLGEEKQRGRIMSRENWRGMSGGEKMW